MEESVAKIIARNFDGTIRKSWDCRYLGRSGEMLTFVGEFSEEVHHEWLGHIQKGTISYEYYWLDRWYNVFRFHEPTGELRNYYCNINMPPTFVEGVLEYVDLDLDLIVWPDFRYLVLDRDEFEANAVKFAFSPELVEQAEAALQTLIDCAEAGDFGIRDADGFASDAHEAG